MKEAVKQLLSQLDEDGQQKAGTFTGDELEKIYDELELHNAPFYKGRIEAAIEAKSRGNTVDNSSDQKLTQIIDLLQPVSRMAVDRLAQSCAASNISAEDLQKVRDILNYVVLPAPENEDSEPVILHEDFWDERFEVDRMADAKSKVMGWSPSRRHLMVKHVRNKVLKSIPEGLPFRVSASNDLVLILKHFSNDAQHGALVGIELKKKLTEKGQRQAELDFVLCSLASYFPYMQFLTDLEHGGSVFFRPQVVAENGADVIIRRDFHSMSDLEAFYRAAAENIMPDLGRIDGHGNVHLPSSLDNPSRKRRHSGGSGDAGGGNDRWQASGKQPGPEDKQRSFELGIRLIADMVANEQDVANVAELDHFDLHDTSCLPVRSC